MDAVLPVAPSLRTDAALDLKTPSTSVTAVENRPSTLPGPLVSPPAVPTSMSMTSPHRPRPLKLIIQLSSKDVDAGAKDEVVLKPTPPNGAFANLKKENRGKKSSSNTPETILEAVRGDGPADLANEVGRLKKLGKGAGGTVYLGCFVPTLKLIAIKEVQLFHEEDFAMVTHELHALHDNLVPLEDEATHKSLQYLGKLFHRKLHIGNVHACRDMVAFYGAYATPEKSSVSIAMEYMNAGTLQDFVDAKKVVPETVLRQIAHCTMKALHHMQLYHMLHRDIKPANILMNTRGDFKIADFGLAATLSKSKSYFSEFQGTLMYMSPERITGQNYSYPSDIWAVGIVLLTLAMGAYPFEKQDGFFGLEDSIVNETMPTLPSPAFSTQCNDFVHALLAKDPAGRLSAFQALEHPFLAGYEPNNVDFAKAWATLHSPRNMSADEIQAIVAAILEQERAAEVDEFDFHSYHILHHARDTSTYQMSFK
ncbi:serine/threonine protein kinase, variant 1 [Aphanomyces invadans]|nr:serine/threonine protein kinase, variant 1 [Aphanomyces invadans]ETV98447.1 serine/threonine protein kinase, variant 1 [Aphanomyces invadans]|eukprot:XP_008872644.1 serine/threonine protein kinase, variant 1 [Aphanomyces invadans]